MFLQSPSLCPRGDSDGIPAQAQSVSLFTCPQTNSSVSGLLQGKGPLAESPLSARMADGDFSEDSRECNTVCYMRTEGHPSDRLIRSKQILMKQLYLYTVKLLPGLQSVFVP